MNIESQYKYQRETNAWDIEKVVPKEKRKNKYIRYVWMNGSPVTRKT